jgi:hypothetical protein
MTQESILRIAEELTRDYQGSTTAREAQVIFVRIPKLHYPEGCVPATSAALVILDPQQATPKLLLKTPPRLKNGRQPRNVSGESAAGEGWYTFSFAQSWDEKNNTGLQFVEGRLRRFALDD